LWLPALLLLILASTYWWGPVLWYRIQLSYWYERTAGHEAPGDTVAWKVQSPSSATHVFRGYFVPAWHRFYTLVSPPGLRSDGTPFVGELRTRSGRDVLVAVDVTTYAPLPQPNFHIRAFTPGAGWTPPKQVLDHMRGAPLPLGKNVRVFVGRSDPANLSHFTIPFEIDGRAGTIDGWLQENDDVLLEVRPSATTQPLPASPG
jgi:hypothetical protein